MDDLVDGKRNDLWQIPNHAVIPRQPAKMVKLITPLLQCTQKVIFVDPHFFPDKKRYRDPLFAFLQKIHEIAQQFQRTIEVAYHVEIENETHENNFKQMADKKLPGGIPKGMRLQFVQWEKKALHDRYVLTDIGGVNFGHGLDQSEDGPELNVFRMNEEAYKKYYRQFSQAAPFHSVEGRLST